MDVLSGSVPVFCQINTFAQKQKGGVRTEFLKTIRVSHRNVQTKLIADFFFSPLSFSVERGCSGWELRQETQDQKSPSFPFTPITCLLNYLVISFLLCLFTKVPNNIIYIYIIYILTCADN